MDNQVDQCMVRLRNHKHEGKKLDEIHKMVEAGKRPYQNVLKVVISAVVTAAVCFLIGLLIHWVF